MADVDVAAVRAYATETAAKDAGAGTGIEVVHCCSVPARDVLALLARLEAAEAVIAAARQASEEYDTGTDCPCDCGLCQIARTLAAYDRVAGTGGEHGE